MTALFQGGEMDAFSPSDGSVNETSSSPGTNYNSAFARCAISFGGFGGSSISYAETAHWTPVSEGYLHFDLRSAQPIVNSAVNDTIVSLRTSANVTVIRLRYELGDLFRLQYLDNLSAWQTAGTFTATNNLTAFDIHWNIDASGELDVYVAGTNRLSWTGDLSHLADIAYARLHCHYNWPFYSQVFADTEPTIGERLYTLQPTGTGSNTAWTGTYAEVDEIAYSDGDFINSGTASQVETFAITPPSLTGYVVKNVSVSARAKTDGSGPSNIQLALRSSGTDYFSASSALDVAYEPHQNTWATNPATSAAWVNSAVATLQPGVKSIT